MMSANADVSSNLNFGEFFRHNISLDAQVVGRVFSQHFEKQGQDIASSIDLDSDIYNPTYALRLQVITIILCIYHIIFIFQSFINNDNSLVSPRTYFFSCSFYLILP